MKKKIVLWGNDAEDKKVLIALELKEKENKVNIYTFKEEIVSEEFYNGMMDQWRRGKDVAFPEGHETLVRELSVTDDILPETLKVQRADLITRAKAEWHFVVLSTKLYDLYNSELVEIKDRIEKLVDFDSNIWEEVKGFWGKVVEQSRERNLFRDHSEKLKDETNELFTKLKEFKAKANAELSQVSKKHMSAFMTRLEVVKEKALAGKSLNPLLMNSKKIQNEFNTTEFTRNDRSKVWKKIDDGFKTVKEKKYGKQQATAQLGALARLEKRYQGLKSAIGKMQASINRDKKDIDFQSGKSGRPMGQLEMQLRQAKVGMVEERISSKQEKLDEMLETKVVLESRMEKEREKAAALEVKKEVEKKKAEVKEKIKAEMDDSKPEISEEQAAKLKAAAADINSPKKKKAKKAKAAEEGAVAGEGKVEPQQSESVLGAAATMLTEAAENMIDTVKAVSSVVSDKIEDTVDAVKEQSSALKEDVAEAISPEETAESGVEAEAADTLKQGGIVAAAVAAGSALIKEASDKMDEVAKEVGLDETIEKAKATLQETTEAVKDSIATADESVDAAADRVRKETQASGEEE